MDERLRRAAQSGDIDALYALIKDDGYVFERLDQMGFVDTPLHVAAAAGQIDFVMEIMNLKPSFARKLNQDGFSPIHLALEKGYTDMVVDLLSIDKDLVRVKGREGYTPLHYVANDGNVRLLSQFLDHCPDCILDLTIRKETALHIVAKKNNFEAFQIIMKLIHKTPEGNLFQRRIINLQDKDGNTVLHIAASYNQAQMIKLLMACEEIDKNKTNQIGLTALDVLRQRTLGDSRESLKILTRAASRVSRFSETKLKDYFKEMRLDTINALLVVFALVLAMTYQSILQPPGGVVQGDGSGSNKDHVGNSIVDTYNFLWFFIPNGIAFFMAWIITLVLLGVVARSIITFLYPLYFLMATCYYIAIGIIAPSGTAANVAVGATIFLSILLCYTCIFLFRKQ